MDMAPLKQFLSHIAWVIYSLETKFNGHWYISTVLLHISCILQLEITNFEANGSSITLLWHILWASYLNNICKLNTNYAIYATEKCIHLHIFFSFLTITSIRWDPIEHLVNNTNYCMLDEIWDRFKHFQNLRRKKKHFGWRKIMLNERKFQKKFSSNTFYLIQQNFHVRLV